MSQVLKFNQWVETEGADLEGLDQLKGYGDYYRLASFAEGSFDQEAADDVDARLLHLARERGLVNEFHDDLAKMEYIEERKSDDFPDKDLERVIAHKHHLRRGSKDKEGEQILREYYSLKNLAREEEVDPELLAEKAEEASQYFNPRDINEGKRTAVLRGEIPFAIFEDDEHKTQIEVDPNIGPRSDQDLANFAKNNRDLVSSRDLPMLKSLLEVPNGMVVPGHEVLKNAELRQMFGGEVPLSEEVQEILNRTANLESYGSTDRALETAEELTRIPILQERYSRDHIINAAMDYAKEVSVKGEPKFLSTGEIVMPRDVLLNKEEHDKMVNAMPITDGQKALTIKVRRARLEAMVPHYHKMATMFRHTSKPPEGYEDYTAFFEARKAQGVSDVDIIEEWYGDKEHYDHFKSKAAGVFFGVAEGFTGTLAYPMVVFDKDVAGIKAEEVREVLGSLALNEAMRQEYASLFGEKFGVGYTILRTAPAVAADIALSVVTRGPLGVATFAARAGVRGAAKLAFKVGLSKTTKAAARKAMKEGAAGSISKTLKSASKDWAKQSGFRKFSRGVVNQGSLSLIPTTFNRSAGATYVSIYSALEAKNPGWDSEQLREASLGHSLIMGATTTGIVLAFQGLATSLPKFFGAGAEDWVAGSGTGLTIRQLNRAYQYMKNSPGRIPKEMRGYVDMKSFNTFLAGHIKEGSRNSLLAYGRHGWSEGLEESIDQFVNVFVEGHATDEDVNIIEAFAQAKHAFIVGAAFGGMGAVRSVGLRKGDLPPEARTGKRAERARQQFFKRQRKVERDTYLKFADTLEAGGNTESARFLRMQANAAAANRKVMTEQLEEFGKLAARQEKIITATATTLEKAQFTPAQTQRKLDRLEEMLSGEAGLEHIPVEERTPEQMVSIVAARKLRDKYADVAAGKRMEDPWVGEDPRPEGDRPPPAQKRPPKEIKDASGRLIGWDRGTGYAEPVIEVEDKADADAKIEKINSELKRLGGLGAGRNAYQNERIKILS